jgi:hypothetical protein
MNLLVFSLLESFDPLGVAEPASPCQLSCVDLAVFEWALGSRTCFCDLDSVAEADAAMRGAMATTGNSAVGALAMLMSAIWVLMQVRGTVARVRAFAGWGDGVLGGGLARER